jgi:hypothetical protein
MKKITTGYTDEIDKIINDSRLIEALNNLEQETIRNTEQLKMQDLVYA